MKPLRAVAAAAADRRKEEDKDALREQNNGDQKVHLPERVPAAAALPAEHGRNARTAAESFLLNLSNIRGRKALRPDALLQIVMHPKRVAPKERRPERPLLIAGNRKPRVQKALLLEPPHQTASSPKAVVPKALPPERQQLIATRAMHRALRARPSALPQQIAISPNLAAAKALRLAMPVCGTTSIIPTSTAAGGTAAIQMRGTLPAGLLARHGFLRPGERLPPRAVKTKPNRLPTTMA